MRPAVQIWRPTALSLKVQRDTHNPAPDLRSSRLSARNAHGAPKFLEAAWVSVPRIAFIVGLQG
jgi:hypothetical protein